jgi:hypothetical protein
MILCPTLVTFHNREFEFCAVTLLFVQEKLKSKPQNIEGRNAGL